MHILLIGPLLFYIGHHGKKTQQIAFNMLATLILIIPFIVYIPSFNKLNFRLIFLMHFPQKMDGEFQIT